MAKPLYRKTYIKEWRQRRGKSLRRLAEMMEVEPGGDLLVSHAQIGRIENGEQPYNQPILEAIANALDVDVVDLLETNPEKDGEVIDIMRKLKGDKRDEAIRYLNYLLTA